MNTQVDLTEIKDAAKNGYYLQKGYEENDEIDLAKLFSILWQGKKIILGFTVIFTLLASFYAFTTQEWWTSNAVITQAKSTQLLPIYKQIKQLEPAFDNVGDGSEKGELAGYLSSRFFLDQFIQKFNSDDNKVEFLSKNKDFLNEIARIIEEKKEVELERIFQSWDKKIKAESIKGTRDFDLSFSTFTAKSSEKLLTEYIKFINNKLLNETYSDISAVINSRKLALQKRIELTYGSLKSQLEQEIYRIKSAYEIAKAANITRPIENILANNQNLETLGSDILAQKVLNLEKLTNLSVLENEPKLNKYYAQLDSLQQVEISIQDAITYYLVDKPSEPITRDKPKRSLILVFGFLLGGVLGTVFVLLKNAFMPQKENIAE